MDGNLFENTGAVLKDDSPKVNKTWEYKEKINRHTVHHTLSLREDKLTHISEMKEVAQNMRTRRDIKLSDVRAVHTYYGMSRNLALAIVLALFGVIIFLSAIVTMGASGEFSSGAILLVLGAGLGGLAYWVYTRIRPSFVLEIEMYIPENMEIDEGLAYGNAGIRFGKGLFGAVRYKLVMDPETGHDIVDHIGAYLIGE